MRFVIYGSYKGSTVKLAWQDGRLEGPAELVEAVDAVYRASGARVALPHLDGAPVFPDPSATARALSAVLDRITGLEEHGGDALDDTGPLDVRAAARPLARRTS